MNEAIQDADLAKADMVRQDYLAQLRAPWEATWQEVDERFPIGAGGFTKSTPGAIRGARNYDSTHIEAIKRFAAAGVAITTPKNSEYIRPVFLDEDLMKIRSVKLWCERAGRRLQAVRHASHTGFGVSANEDWDQLGRYGTSPVWEDATARGLQYRTLHLAECYIDVDAVGLVDTFHRKFTRTARQLEGLFGMDNLTPKMREALEKPGQEHKTFEILHCVLPNRSWDSDAFDHRRFPFSSRYLALDEKIYIRRAGYYTMPVSVSRHITSAEEIYGRSPAIDTMPNIQGVNAMKLTTLRAGHKAVDPALIFNNDDGVTKLVSKPGGMNPGMVDDSGRAKVLRMPGGEQGLPYAVDMIQDERATIRAAFLEDFYKILTDPNSRMTTTEVLEVMAKQGVLVQPYASRYETEKQHPMCNRDLELARRWNQIEDFPAEVKEAGAWPMIHYENPLAAMARAESSGKTLRYIEALPVLAQLDPDVPLMVDAPAIARGLAEEMGVKPSYIRDPEEVAAMKQEKDAVQRAAMDAELLEKGAGAAKDFAQANAIAEAA